MLFDFEDRHFETPTVDSAMSWREQVLLSIFAHVALVLLVLLVPRLAFVRAAEERRAARVAELAEQQAEALALARLADRDRTFVFIEPLVDIEPQAAPRPDAPLSDRDRIAQSPEMADDPLNTLPNAEGNSANFVEAEDPEEGAGPDRDGLAADVPEEEPIEADPAAGESDGVAEDPVENADVADASRSVEGPAEDEGDAQAELLRPELAGGALTLPGGREDPDEPAAEADRPADGLLGRARRNFERYARRESFANRRGRLSQYDPDLQFDSKGADFGPWIRRFIAQVRRNWFVPYAIMSRSMHGNVVLTFYVNRDGSLTDLQIVRPAAIDAFTNSAFNALATSNPTQPLPSDFPDDRCFFTVTFYFNESPPV